MKETDPFEDFKIFENQKGFFEYFNHEAKTDYSGPKWGNGVRNYISINCF